MIIEELIWDERNINHIARHNVIPEEVEEVIQARIQVNTSRNQTYRIIGQTDSGRYLTVFLAHKGKNRYYVVTARDASLQERRLFRKK